MKKVEKKTHSKQSSLDYSSPGQQKQSLQRLIYNEIQKKVRETPAPEPKPKRLNEEIYSERANTLPFEGTGGQRPVEHPRPFMQVR